MVPLRDPIRNLVYSAQAEDLHDAMIDGRWVMRERVVLHADERAGWRSSSSSRRRRSLPYLRAHWS
jgi:5-methylthioadenosine/S-adenosylhomocysteine deaminase